MAIDVAKVIKRYDKHVQERALWDEIWRNISTYELPKRLLTLDHRKEGEQLNENMMDSTVTFAAEVLASSLQSGVTNQEQKWFSLRISDDLLMEDDEVRLWLEDSNLRMLNAFKSSNMAPELGELYMDLGVFGTGAVFLGEGEAPDPRLIGGFRGFQFQSVPLGNFVLEEDGFGRVSGIMYERKMSYQAAADRWGKEKLHPDSQKILEDDPLMDLVTLHTVVPKTSISGASTVMPWVSLWAEKTKKHELSEGGFREFPFMVPRWSKATGEIYGRGPGYTVLPDVRTLNKLIELELKALALAVLPPQKTRLQSIIGALDFSPGGLTIVRNMDDIQPINPGSDFQASKITKEDLRLSIRQGFYVDQLLQLLARSTPAMTATEVQVKLHLLQQILGPTFGRLTSELWAPMVERGFKMMERAGGFLPRPEILQGQKIQVEFEGPLARGQRGQELIAIERTLQVAANLTAMEFPEVRDNLNPDEILRLSARIAGAPESIILTSDDVKRKRQERQSQEQGATALSGIVEASQVAKNIAPLAKIAQEDR